MATKRRNLLGLLLAGAAAACLPGRKSARAQGTPAGSGGSLVGAWRIAALRATGAGVNLLTFTSDGTFFRSGDTHPVLSVGHGVWAPVGGRDFGAGSGSIYRAHENEHGRIGRHSTRHERGTTTGTADQARTLRRLNKRVTQVKLVPVV